MRFFFKSRQFKIALAVVAVIVALSVLFNVTGGTFSPHTSIFGAVAAPFQAAANGISNAAKGFKEKVENNEAVVLENARLKEQIDELNSRIADYDSLKSENDFLKDYLEIKKENPDFQFKNASVIARDSTDVFMGFNVNAGSLAGVKMYDPVITSAGLVGYVSQVGLTTSKVTTVLNPEIAAGAVDSRTSDAGVIGGTLEDANNGNTRMYNIQRSSVIAIGDYVVTSGSGVFPSGIAIGKIVNISKEDYTSSLYAVVEPFVNISEIKEVMIITDFNGKQDFEK